MHNYHIQIEDKEYFTIDIIKAKHMRSSKKFIDNSSHSFNRTTQQRYWVLLPLRLFLGITFLYAGLQKILDPQFFQPDATGYIGKQIVAFAQTSPLHVFLQQVVVPNAMIFGLLVAFGEIAIGLGTLFGVLLRPAAFFGLLISLIFFLSATWRVYPYFYGSDIVFLFCWITLFLNGAHNTGLPTLDQIYGSYLIEKTPTPHKARQARLLGLLLGITTPLETVVQPLSSPQAVAPALKQSSQVTQASPTSPSTTIPLFRPPFGNLPTNNRIPSISSGEPALSAQTAGRISSVPQVQPQSGPTAPQSTTNSLNVAQIEAKRRQFLGGLFVGVAGTIGIAATTYVLRIFAIGNTITQTKGTIDPTPISTVAPTSTPSIKPTPTPQPIARIDAVKNNSAVHFKLPSNGNPGILVRLNSGQFVAYDATCTHAGCPVDYDVKLQLLVCPCHGAEYDPARQAAVVHEPAVLPLTPVAIQVDSTTGAITLPAS